MLIFVLNHLYMEIYIYKSNEMYIDNNMFKSIVLCI